MARPPLHPESALLLSLLTDGLRGDRSRLEASAVAAIRRFRRSDPALAEAMAAALAQFRSGLSPAAPILPTDPESAAFLLRGEAVPSVPPPAPILPPETAREVDRFVRERRAAGRLLAEGFEPPRSLLLHGAPGTGKTLLARWLAAELALPLATLDLAAAISSLLGRTGLNLRRVFEHGRRAPCVLFLDEFDAVAKRRDDPSDLGELKRAVNVLLKEMEQWPSSSILVAATNHPGLLDPAVFRRFDIVIALPLPGAAEREALLLQAWPDDPALASALAFVLKGETPAALAAYAERTGRERVVGGGSLRDAAFGQALSLFGGLPARRAALAAAERRLQKEGKRKGGKSGAREKGIQGVPGTPCIAISPEEHGRRLS